MLNAILLPLFYFKCLKSTSTDFFPNKSVKAPPPPSHRDVRLFEARNPHTLHVGTATKGMTETTMGSSGPKPYCVS